MFTLGEVSIYYRDWVCKGFIAMKRDRKIDFNFIIKCIIAFVLIFCMLAVNYYVLYTHVRSNAISGREREVMKAAMDFNYFLVESVDAIKLTAQTIDDMQQNGAGSSSILEYLETTSSVYGKTIDRNFTGFYGYINGKYLDGVGWVPDADYDPKTRPWYLEAKEKAGETTFVSPYVDSQTGTVTMSVSKLLSDNNSVVSVDITLDDIQRKLEEATIRNEWKYGMIIDADGVVVAHSEISEIGKNYNDEESGMGALFTNKFSDSDSNYHVMSYGGENYLAMFADIGGGWRVISVIEAGDVLGSIRIILAVFVISFIVIFSLIIFMFVRMRKKQEAELYMSRQMESMANIYDFAYLINIVEDTYYEIADNDPELHMIIDESNKSAVYNLRAIMDAITDKRYKKTVFAFIDFKTLDERLDNKIVISKMFIGNNNQKYGIRIVPVSRDEEGRLVQIIFMAETIENV